MANPSFGSMSPYVGRPKKLYSINVPKPIPDVCDDEFNDPILDSKWVVVSGTRGTVNLFGTAGGIYDLVSAPGLLCTQILNGSNVFLRQDFTLPDGCSIVVAGAPSIMMLGQSGVVNNSIHLYLGVNDDDTGFTSGNYSYIGFDTNTDGYRILAGGSNVASSSGTPSAAAEASVDVGDTYYFRISRVGLLYYPSFSKNGLVWNLGNPSTFAAAGSNIWLISESVANTGSPRPIMTWDWIRMGSNKMFPWQYGCYD